MTLSDDDVHFLHLMNVKEQNLIFKVILLADTPLRCLQSVQKKVRK